MKKIKQYRTLSLVLVAAYVLSACGGTLPGNVNTNDAVSTISALASSTPVLPVASATSQPGSAVEVEVFGFVESMTDTALTVNGVTYNIVANLTEFRDVISVGDQVKIDVIVNADGTFTIRDIEISIGNDNGNGNSNDNTNSNSNDDNSNDSDSNDDNNNDSNSNDDNNNDANSNDDNSSDDNGNDNDSSGSGGGNDNDDDGGNDNADNDNG
ncbi:MAG TPA: DUF5666 domain-containing protein [Anaerolineales bacterium]|nr:DUF5666 domain-containing protein [Anaerolineales bacterium]